jgi:macrolide-specific efflux system membrane fusion protein
MPARAAANHYTILEVRMKLSLKILSLCIAIALAFAAKAYLFPAPQSVQYLTADVSKGDIRETVLATGTLEAFKQVSVGAQVSGQVKSLKVALGDAVKKGDLIAEIDSQSRENDLRIAEAKLEDVKAQLRAKEAVLTQAESEFKRQQGMPRSSAMARNSAAECNPSFCIRLERCFSTVFTLTTSISAISLFL